MVHRNIEDVELPRFLWKKLNKTNRVNENIAFDTETIDGECFLIADSKGCCVNDNEFKNLEGLLQFLNQKRYRETTNWFYNLEYDTNAILHFLSFRDRKFMAENDYVDYKGYRIQIIPRKELTISVLKNDKLLHTTAFYDLAQFYNFKKLATLAETTEYQKVYVADISTIDKIKYYNDEDYYQLINDRCVIDCKIAGVKANELTDNINKIVVLNKYKSKASIARRYVLENITHNLKMPSKKLLDVALKSYHAGHIETCKMGMCNNVQNYDIKSAYPSFIADLHETSGAYMHNMQYEPDTAYSFYQVTIDYENDYLSPMWYLKTNRNYHATGKFETWITQSEIEYLMSQGIDLKIMSAYHIRKDAYTEKPFHDIVHELYEKRLKAKDDKDEIELVYKVILNSIYGVTLNTIQKKILSDYETDTFELKDDKLVFYKSSYRATNMYNPVYGTYITAGTRSKIFTDFGYDAHKIIAISTDGVYKFGKNNVSVSKKLGEYGHKKIAKMLVMGSGRYFFINSDGTVDDKESRFRGIPKQTSEIYSLMQQNRKNDSLEVWKNKPIKLKESIKNSKYYNLTFSTFPVQDYNLVDQFNVFTPVKKDIRFSNNLRYWFDELNTINDLWDTQFESRPFDVQEIQ